MIGTRIVTRRFIGDMAGLIRFLSHVAIGTSLAAIGFALAPNIVVAVAFNCVISAVLAMLGPGILVALSLAIPPRARATGFSRRVAVGDPRSARPADHRMDHRPRRHSVGHAHARAAVRHRQPHPGHAPDAIDADIAQVWQASAARSEALYQRRQGQTDLLLVRDARRRLRRSAGAVRRRASTSRKARSSPSSAPTAPARARC